MVHLCSVKKWSRNHIVKHEGEEFYTFYCERTVSKDLCTEVHHENYGIDTCQHCVSLYRNAARCASRVDIGEIGIGSIVQVPKEISETGKIRIVADQINCQPNTLQPEVSDWEYKAVEYDPDCPNEHQPSFNVTRKELEEWKEIY